VNYTDPAGPSGSKPGGPYHPPLGFAFGCNPEDSCALIKGKIWIIERMLYSHIGWDFIMPDPRGGLRHAKEISDPFNALANREKLKERNCNDVDCPKKQPNPPQSPVPGMLPWWFYMFGLRGMRCTGNYWH
jgi:hypothetical protein